jgi:hypothetical protein
MAKPTPLEEALAEFQALGRRMASLEEDRRADSDLIQRIAVACGLPVVAGDPGGRNVDAPVLCPKCGAKVGYYDADTEVVRARSGAHLVMMRMGPGGSIIIVCRACSFHVEITYAPPDQAAQVEVRDGLLVFDVRKLSDLLSEALNSGSGQVTLRLVPTSR